MAAQQAPDGRSRPFLGPRNLVLLGAAVIALTLGYVLLHNGGTTVAAALLVLGYCVLFPLGVAL